MDRRQKKTREAIFRAFGSLLEKKRFETITVQEIIEAADIGRSTFYAHFETKDSLLREMCTDIFHHVFTKELPEESAVEEAAWETRLELKLGHVLYHLRENRLNLKGLLASESGELFMSYFKEHLQELFGRFLGYLDTTVPVDFLLHYLVGGFAETVKWWVKKGMEQPPEEVAAYYMAVLGK